MIKNVKFRDVKCNFQKKLSPDVKNIKRNDALFVPADKTTNFYKMDTTDPIANFSRKTSPKRTKKSPPKQTTKTTTITLLAALLIHASPKLEKLVNKYLTG